MQGLRSQIQPGTRLNDTYQIDSLIGVGGMGEIYRGREIQTGNAVAIKMIRPDMTGNRTAFDLFQREASVLRTIRHDAIVQYFIFSFDQAAQRYYLAMEFVDGVPLSEVLKTGPLPYEAVTALRRRVAEGLEVAHARGVVHRDLSPDNILVPGGDVSRAKIIDFGIARVQSANTGTIIGGGFAGKYNYVSPEQLGLAGGEVTAKSDIYSFGLVLAEAALGRPLDMDGSQAEVIEKRRRVPNLDGVDRRLRPLLDRMLRPDPAERPASMTAVADWGGTRRASTSKAVGGSATGGSARTERWIVGGALAAVVIGALGFGAYLFLTPPSVKPLTKDLVQKETLHETGGSHQTVKNEGVGGEKSSKAGHATGGTTDAGQHSAASAGASDPLARIVRYIQTYDGGPCFFAQLVRATGQSAGIAGFSTSSASFDALDHAFTQTIGFEPDVTGQKVWSQQCPAVDFLRTLDPAGVGAPRLFLRNTRVKNGERLSGGVSAFGNQSVSLWQVAEDGSMHDLSSALKPDGADSLSFDIPIAGRTDGGPFPELLLAITTPKRLAPAPTAADAAGFFRGLQTDAGIKGEKLSATAKLFLHGG